MTKSVIEKSIHIDMPDRSVWAVPVRNVANHRASYYAKRDGVTQAESLANETLPLFEEDNDEVMDWLENNMDWVDVKDDAVLVKSGKVHFQEGLVNGDKEIV